MIEVLVFAIVATLVMAAVGAVAAVFGFLAWLLVLPFKMLAIGVKAILFLFTLPLILVFGVIALAFGGFGLLFLLVPMLPFVLLAMFIIWLVRHNRPRPTVTNP